MANQKRKNDYNLGKSQPFLCLSEVIQGLYVTQSDQVPRSTLIYVNLNRLAPSLSNKNSFNPFIGMMLSLIVANPSLLSEDLAPVNLS